MSEFWELWFGTGATFFAITFLFRYKTRCDGWDERHKMVMCHSCFHKMLDFCGGNEKVEWEESEATNETENETDN